VMLRGKAAEDRLLLLNGKHRHIFLPAIAAAAQKPFHPLPPAERRILHQALGVVQQPWLLVAERLQHQLFLGGKEGIEKGLEMPTSRHRLSTLVWIRPFWAMHRSTVARRACRISSRS